MKRIRILIPTFILLVACLSLMSLTAPKAQAISPDPHSQSAISSCPGQVLIRIKDLGNICQNADTQSIYYNVEVVCNYTDHAIGVQGETLANKTLSQNKCVFLHSTPGLTVRINA
jgi:hypothetical protein